MTDTQNPTSNPSTGKGTFALPTTLYDALKDTALIYLPAVGVLYSALAAIWGWGHIAEVSGTVIAVDTFLGVVLKISKTSYDNSDKSNDGTLVIDQSDPTADKYALNVTTPLEKVADADKLVLKVDNQTVNSAAVPVDPTPTSMDPRNVVDGPSQ